MNKRIANRIKTLFLIVGSAIAAGAFAEFVWISCSRCNGRGLLCRTCNNTGIAQCSMCGGRGGYYGPGPFGSVSYNVCIKCGGMGTTMCMDCIMTSVGCPDCGARGGRFVER